MLFGQHVSFRIAIATYSSPLCHSSVFVFFILIIDDAGVLAIGMMDVEVVVVDIAIEGVQSAVNETADEENK